MVTALTEKEVPAVLISISNPVQGGSVLIENFFTDKLGELNVLAMVNANTVILNSNNHLFL